ncbi:MAG: hypothetical protein COA58_06760 [Bacteroidetes bacterium]|nr:MAG: hypothetical protein COA58_06760 [Bacteroidota bacterium]
MRLYHTQEYNSEKHYDEDVYAQLQHLKHEMHENNAAVKMQRFFPEGFLFQNALYGLTWSELVSPKTHASIKQEALKEIDWALSEMSSTNGTQIFSENLPLNYGVFYRGWSNYLLAKRVSIEGDSSLLHLLDQNCIDIEKALGNFERPYLESYSNACWPADNILALASLDIANELLENKYGGTQDNWIVAVKSHLDENGLIPHSTDFITGNTQQMARGNSQSLMLCLLWDIDSNFAQLQFDIYKEQFVDSRLGLPGIRENRKGLGGNGDVDSGPVIWGIGGAASVVGQKTMAQYGEWDIYEGLRNSVETFGAAYTVNGKKKYVFGSLPMADAFIAWSNVSATEAEIQSSNWRWKFQLISLGVGFILFWLIRKLK